MRSKFDALIRRLSGKRTAVIAAGVVGVVVITAGGALATRAATNQLADATISKLGGGDPQAVLDSIARSVVEKLTGKNGAIGAASKSITDKLGKAAGSKLADIDTDSLLNKVSDEVVAAGMGKLDAISTDAIVDQVTNALIETALAQVEALDLQALAADALDDTVEDLLAGVDLQKLIEEKLDEVDVEGIVAKVVAEELNNLTGGVSGGNLLGLLFQR